MRRALLAIALVTNVAHADGAFPDSFAMFAPSDQPNTLRLATNFGLVSSDDDAKSWHYVCENAVIAFANLYSQGPDDALYAVSTLGLVSSRNGGCSWDTAQGSLAFAAVDDVFADPSDPMNVLAIARVVQDGGTAGETQVYRSRDGGLTFGDPIYTPPAGMVLTGVEIARSDPQTVYLTMYQPGPHAYLARSQDGGASFTIVDIGTEEFPRLIAVDPNNPRRLFLRLGSRSGDSLGISDDGGVTIVRPLMMPGKMSAFLLRADGTILVGGLTVEAGSAWRSTDGGKTFADWNIHIHLRGLAERGSRLYAVADDVLDKAALFQSDDGDTLTPILRFRNILSPAQCGNVASTCAIPWAQLQPLINPTVDGGASDLGVSDGGSDGCGCHLGRGSVSVMPFVCILLVAVSLRRRVL